MIDIALKRFFLWYIINLCKERYFVCGLSYAVFE